MKYPWLKDAWAWLVAPHDVETFYAARSEGGPLHIGGRDAGYFAELYGLEEFERMLFSAAEPVSRSMRVLKDGERAEIDPAKLLAQMHSAYEQGYTLQVDSVGRFCPAVAHLARAIEAEIRGPVHLNLYFTPANAKGFPAHADDHDAIVLQVHGSKHWRVYEARPELIGDSLDGVVPTDEQLGEPALSPTLSAGDLLYLPLGRFHQAETSEDASLHLTIGTYPYSAGQLLLETIRQLARSDPAFMAPVRGWGDSAEAKIDALLSCVKDNLRIDDRLDHQQAAFISGMSVLPADLFEVSPTFERADQRVAKRPGMVCFVRADGERAEIGFPAGGLKGPPTLAATLKFIAETTDPFTAEQLPGLLPTVSKLVLVRRLIAEGLLVVCEP